MYLKFDGVTRLRKHFLGISVQFVNEEGHLVGKTLALVDTKSKSDAESTKEIVFETLEKFGVDRANVLGCVVDNASAMTKTIRRMNEEIEVEDDWEDEESTDDAEDGIEMEAMLMNVAEDFGIHHMRCAAHTLQLGLFCCTLALYFTSRWVYLNQIF